MSKKTLFYNKYYKGGITYFIAFLMCLNVSNLWAQETMSVSGVVVDELLEPLIGVTVLVEGTSTGTITDFDGKYLINNVEKGKTLVFSYIGYQTIKIEADKSVINVNMKDDSQNLDEVVVVGFGSQKKVNLTGSVAVADAETFAERPVTTATQALQGLVPGLNITSNTGNLGSNPSLNIRGTGTIGSGSNGSPLVLIDGIEGDINTLNPQDIETVSVLKDAASSSIYGSRAPFGVILITTKRGKSGKMTVNYNNSFRFSSQVNVPKAANSLAFANLINDAYTNNNKSPFFGLGENDDMWYIEQYMQGNLEHAVRPSTKNPELYNFTGQEAHDNIDWFDEVYDDSAFGQEHNLTVSGGSEDHQIYMSANYLNQGGFIALQKDRLNRYSTNLSASGNIFKFLKYNYNIKFLRRDYTEPYGADQLSMASSAWPTTPKYDAHGNLGENLLLLLRDCGKETSRQDRLYQQFKLVATPLKGWNITGEINYRLLNQRNHEDTQVAYIHNVAGDPYQTTVKIFPTKSSVYEKSSSTNYYNTNVFSDYEFDINDNHNLKAMIGFQAEKNILNSLSASRDGIIVPYMDVIDITSGVVDGSSSPVDVTGLINQWATIGFFGRLNYNYKERYLAEANLRYDGTSRFRKDKRWNFFPSFSVGWNVARESFWEPYTNILSTFKFRASYGELGNQNTSNLYPTFQQFPIGITNGDWLVNGQRPNTSNSPALLNSAMTWERVESLNFGLDYAALNNRISGSFDFFNRKTKDMIGPAPTLPSILGTAVPKANNTDLETKGWELSIRWRDRISKKAGYSVVLLLSDSKTVISNYPNPNKNLLFSKTDSKVTGNTSDYYSGQNLGEIWGLTTVGIAKTDEEMENHIASLPNGGQNALGQSNNLKAGDIMYADLNGDGKIDFGSSTIDDSGDLSIIGNNTPRYRFGVNLNFDYQGFDFGVFFQGVMKRDFAINATSFWGVSEGIWRSVILEEQEDYFRSEDGLHFKQNLDAYYPRVVDKGKNNYRVQSGYLQNAAYIRLKNIQMGYTFPQNWLKPAHISNLRIFASAENLWTGTKLSSIYDPETIDGPNNGVGYPLTKVISCGLNITF